MELNGKYNGHDVIAYPLNGGTFESPSLGNTRFNSADSLTKALDKLDAEARRDFTNRTAYMISGHYGQGDVIEVQVTSVRNDEAFIVNGDGDRRKVSLNSLFANAADVHTYIAVKRDCETRVKATHAAIPRWKPQK